ncbi:MULTISPECIES: LysR family transcriptional regulator [Arthrobacter]|uniref:LysR family transcriptional regulator n=2 Tax=Arthrobacter TaxID=1663 RepID=A0ABU9KNM9_9MICC|nr:LysR family transcriptional regulator [Arthrobacter sp. YJM1]MDP5228519.1 LysR family transcriptional regulator [Arthrobacter sp. YJM1]
MDMNPALLRHLLPHLPVLAELARTGSVTAAADELGIPQPSASRSLARLAELAGVPLVHRAGRGVALTEAGSALAEVVSRALASVEDGLAAARAQGLAEDATIRVAYQNVLGESYVPRAIARFRTRRPKVRFELMHGARSGCIRWVRDGVADLAVVADPPFVEDLHTVELFTEPLVATMSPQHPLAHAGRAVTVDDLRTQDLIVLRRGYGLHDSMHRILGVQGEIPNTAFEVDDTRDARGLAAAGLGIAVLPPHRGGSGVEVAEVAIDHPAAKRVIGVVTPSSSSGLVDEFVSVFRS